MKKKIFLLILITAAIIKFSGCEFGLEEDVTEPENQAQISGEVAETTTGNPVINASVRITDGVNQVNTVTNSSGKYSTTFPLIGDKELLVITFKEGFSTDTTRVFATAGTEINIPLIKIRQLQSSGSNSSGSASSIYLFSQSSLNIGVKESGSNETALLIFEVLDSAGVPITTDHSVLVNFRFGSSPTSGEYLYPTSVQTNALGRASVILNTGTRAGVAQVIAEINLEGRVIKSNPILISIHGGFPDPGHFDVAAELLNYPAYGIIGYQIPFTAFVGDKYTNPVRPGTSVYFNATSGVIEGSNLTDNLGRSTVTLLTQPFPTDAVFGPGFFHVTASTIDENHTQIETSTIRLLSGVPAGINVIPSTFDLSNGGSQSFSFNIHDQNGNPLSSGTSISVSVTEGDVKVSGDVDITLPDTQDKFFTNFTFTVFDSEPEEDKANGVVITISTTGPNGNKKTTISGTAR